MCSHNHRQTFLHSLCTHQSSSLTGGLSGGGIAGIVIALIFILILVLAIVIVLVMLYERSKLIKEIGLPQPPSRKGSMRIVSCMVYIATLSAGFVYIYSGECSLSLSLSLSLSQTQAQTQICHAHTRKIVA